MVDAKTNYVQNEVLEAVLDWLLHRRPDDPSRTFSITLIDFHDPARLGEMYGAYKASHLLDDFGLALVKALRSGDLVTRFLSTFCVLTPSGKTDKLLERLREIIAAEVDRGLEVLEYSVRSYDFPNERTKHMDGAQLLKALGEQSQVVPTRVMGRRSFERA